MLSHEYQEAAWLFLVALLMDWALTSSDLARPRTASENVPADEPCGILLRAFVRVYSIAQENAVGGIRHLRPILLSALNDLKAMQGSLSPQRPPPSTLGEQHRGRFALCCAHVFIGRFDCHSGPHTISNWASARNIMLQGISHVYVERYLTLQFEHAYTARDNGDNREALVWYDRLIANATRVSTMSAHWKAFVARKIKPQAQQLRFEQESGRGPGQDSCAQQ